ncbi:MAG: stage V sporulation protein T [Butyrivibrio sp.]|nr:stage V sporulation protein T [Butyrivibrio sp.]
MRATGIVRRIDDLGRVVIPKEIRRTLRIREGDALEIFTDRDGEVILKKYSPIGELSEFAKQYAEALAQTTGNIVCITDRDQIIAISGGKKDLLMKPISPQLERLMDGRENLLTVRGEKKFIPITQGEDELVALAIGPILAEGDVIGAVIIASKEANIRFGELEKKLILAAAGFLGRQMEN